ncbi:hypothetical protein DAMA08_007250 [Martiniozyma asiatica (nom. inval.)]|nr:hypothetical protein DAMA08_007250 [Martiniozyma asiatica]
MKNGIKKLIFYIFISLLIVATLNSIPSIHNKKLMQPLNEYFTQGNKIMTTADDDTKSKNIDEVITGSELGLTADIHKKKNVPTINKVIELENI